MRINYDNIPEMMMDWAFWDLIRDVLFEDAGKVAHGVMAKLRIPQSPDNKDNLKIRLRTALWLILTAAATGIRIDHRFSVPPPIVDYDELSDLYIRQFTYLLRLLDRGVGLDNIQRRWGINLKEGAW